MTTRIPARYAAAISCFDSLRHGSLIAYQGDERQPLLARWRVGRLLLVREHQHSKCLACQSIRLIQERATLFLGQKDCSSRGYDACAEREYRLRRAFSEHQAAPASWPADDYGHHPSFGGEGNLSGTLVTVERRRARQA